MEKKTIGSFLAVLRKASGMTQKQLAEKLNVSDKTVSRWERDECAPDLTLIPVLAEIFGVTSDEILRGERISEEKKAEETHKKNEKQLEYILNNLKSKFLIKCLISDAVAVVGLIVAYILSIALFDMDTNSYEAKKIAFLVGCVFYTVAVIITVVFTISAFSSLKNYEFDIYKLKETKKYLIKYTKWSFYIILLILIISINFVIYVPTYREFIGLVIGGILICFFADIVLQKLLIKTGVLTASMKEKIKSSLKRKCIFIALIVLCLTAGIQRIVDYDGLWFFQKGTTYTEFEELKNFLETPMDEDGFIVDPDKNRNYEFLEGYYDGDNATETQDTFNEEDFEKVKVKINENTVKEVILRNQNIVRWSCNLDDDSVDFQLPVTIYTHQDANAAQSSLDIIDFAFVILYIAEIIMAFVFYYKKRNKIFAQKSAK